MDTALKPVSVMFVISDGGTSGAGKAFERLESALGSLKRRRFYGTYDPFKEEYRACVQLAEGDDPRAMKLEQWTIPGGKFATTKIRDWRSKVHVIGKAFDEMASGRKVDPNRPSIEFYKSESEVVLYLPVSD